MRRLTAAELLDLWERCQGLPFDDRLLALLEAFHGESSPGELARLPIGRRDELLLAFREATFGHRVASVAQCPACEDAIELTFDTSEVRASAPAAPAAPTAATASPPAATPGDGLSTTIIAGHEITYRLPSTEDLTALRACRDADHAHALLLERCVSTARLEDSPISVAELPAPVREELGRRVSEADPQAVVELALRCSACGHEWSSVFDIGPYLWAEIDAWAGRVLEEVHALASVYGWSEHGILSLSAWRRHAYLELIRS